MYHLHVFLYFKPFLQIIRWGYAQHFHQATKDLQFTHELVDPKVNTQAKMNLPCMISVR